MVILSHVVAGGQVSGKIQPGLYVDIYVVVNFFISGNFCFSFVFGYGNDANEVEKKKKKNYLQHLLYDILVTRKHNKVHKASLFSVFMFLISNMSRNSWNFFRICVSWLYYFLFSPS